MARRTPEGPPPPPVVQRLRLRYAKRGRLRFTSHRDFARAFERALRRADIPMGYSAGFTPHPKISYVGASPTGVASEAEYLEIGLTEVRDPETVRAALDAALPDGLDVVDAVIAGSGSLADRIEAAHWHLELPGVPTEVAEAALAAFLAAPSVTVERVTKSGHREVDVRGPIVSARVVADARDDRTVPRAILDVVVRQVTPTVRPDDVFAALQSVASVGAVAGLALAAPLVAVRVAQGPLDADGSVTDPLAADRSATSTSS
jgi:radical SAM-linked protein